MTPEFKSLPLVSIVTPTFNGGDYLEELIVSVLEQTYRNIEHIIIDDGSTDNGATLNILRRYPHLRWWTRHNRGQYATLNEGIAAATGEWVTIISSDDKYTSKNAISAAAVAFTQTYDAVYGGTIRVDSGGMILPNEPPRSAPIWLFRYYPGISHCSLFVRRSTLLKSGIEFDSALKYVGDYDWIIRLIRGGFRFKRLSHPIAMYRNHPAQLSLTVNPIRQKELQQMATRYGELNPLVVWAVDKWCRAVKVKNVLTRTCVSKVLTAFSSNAGKVYRKPS